MEERNLSAQWTVNKTDSGVHLFAQAEAIALVPASLARRFVALPLNYDAQTNTLQVALQSTHNVPVLDALSSNIAVKPQLKVQLASAADIHEGIDRYYGIAGDLYEHLKCLRESVADPNTDISGRSVQLIETLLRDAVSYGASDLHLEPELNNLRIRYRIDGVLRAVCGLSLVHWPAMLVRIKVLAELNIAETRAPQDGRFEQTILGRKLDFRVSSFPTVRGEAVVIRLLDNSTQLLDLDQLNLAPETLRRLRHIVGKPAGLIVMTGPTGSGKSTTLYSVLNEIRDDAINIVTLEDPVEYSVSLLRQSSLNPSVKLDFVSGIRAVLRQDPDVLLVGETRDQATAKMVARAALTGHLVMTTLHSHSAVGALSRLHDLGLDLSVLSESLLGLISQRLVRTLCTDCRREVDIPRQYQNLAGEQAVCFESTGCAACNQLGYCGREAVIELYTPSLEMRDLLASRANPGRLRAQQKNDKQLTLLQVGVEKVFQGRTSFAELSRVIDLDSVGAAL